MKLIALTQGKFAQVDDEDFDELNKHTWFSIKGVNTFYAKRNSKVYEGGDAISIPMHRQVMGLKPYDKTIIDHKDRDGLNNQKSNLRFANRSQNNMNKQGRGSSKYLGVSLQVTNVKYYSKLYGTTKIHTYKKWVALIRINGKSTFLGAFKIEEDAALAYNKKAIEINGEFANINII